MFLAHLAAGLAAKKFTPYTSLGTLVLSGLWLDLLWPTFLMLGWERVRVDPGNTPIAPLAFEHYPWSHSLLMAVGWALGVSVLYAFFRRYPKGAAIVGLGVVSHWVLDFVSHRPDLPLLPAPQSPVVGLGLWFSLPATMAVEGVLFVLGLWVYTTHTEPTDTTGRYALAAFGALVPAIYLLNVFGPVPPSAEAVAWGAQAQWLLVAWALWIDRHRVAIRQWR